MGGKAVHVNGLPLIFEHLRKKGVPPSNESANTLLETVRIYHEIGSGEEAAYREALVVAYREYCRRRAGDDGVASRGDGS